MSSRVRVSGKALSGSEVEAYTLSKAVISPFLEEEIVIITTNRNNQKLTLGYQILDGEFQLCHNVDKQHIQRDEVEVVQLNGG